jgi:hypothetical protein
LSWLLDFDDICTIVRENLCAEGASEDAREVKDAESSEREGVVSRKGGLGAEMIAGKVCLMVLAAK